MRASEHEKLGEGGWRGASWFSVMGTEMGWSRMIVEREEARSRIRISGSVVVRGVVGSLRCHHLLDSRSNNEGGLRVVVEARSR